MAIVFIDIDGTLLTRNSGTLYARWLFRRGDLGLADLARSAVYTLRYKLDLLDAAAFFNHMAEKARGESLAELEALGRTFFQEETAGLVRAELVETLEDHRRRGDELVILTASTVTLARPVADHVGVSELLCTELEVDELGKLTGRVQGVPRYGDGKRLAAHEYCLRRRVELGDCWAYADSMTDVPLLEAVGNPCVVAPDPLLRRHARRQGWPVFPDRGQTPPATTS